MLSPTWVGIPRRMWPAMRAEVCHSPSQLLGLFPGMLSNSKPRALAARWLLPAFPSPGTYLFISVGNVIKLHQEMEPVP